MLAFKKYVVIEDPTKLELTGLPFRTGQRVEVVMIADDLDQEEQTMKLRSLFEKTQALPQAKAISEDMIAEEIEEYRAGQ